jgi:predicted metal-dependent hydrolase
MKTLAGSRDHEEERRQDKFIELAERRVQNATKQLELIGNLGNPNFYISDDDQKEKIRLHLEKILNQQLDRLFNYKPTRRAFSFDLPIDDFDTEFEEE